MREALYWTPGESERVTCGLCGHGCVIPDGGHGLCRVRENRGGKLWATTYGRYSSVSPDPIEKKPLYHFMPGTRSLSFGSVGCNLRCQFCQNYEISNEWSLALTREVKAETIPGMARKQGCDSVSWTYNEPTMWYEFTLDASRLLRKAGIPTVYVTNGYIAEAPLRELSGCLDAMNIDVKAFTEEFYTTLTNGSLRKVMETCALAKELGIWIELTNLIIPTRNDDLGDIRRFARWVADGLGPEVPVHFSRFHPDYKMLDLRPTPVETLLKAHAIAREEGLRYVYVGNVPHAEQENTHCHECGHTLIARMGYSVSNNLKKGDACPKCGARAAVVIRPRWIDD
jgi:pyruvate formate lyase activating enzyme